MRTTVKRAAITLAVLLAAGACSNNDGTSASPGGGASSEPQTTSAADYANGVCTAVDDWVTALQDGAQQYQDQIPTSADPSDFGGIKDALAAYAADVVQQTNDMIDQVKALGVPDVDGGGDVAQSMEAALQSVRDLYTQLQEDIESLDATNPTEMVQKLQAMTTQLQQGSSDVQAAFAQLGENADLKTAGEKAPACQDLGNL